MFKLSLLSERIRLDKSFLRFCLIFGLVFLISCKSKEVIHNTVYNNEPSVVALKEKYAKILHLENQEVRNIALYQNIEDWTIVKDSNINELSSLNINFVQYLYYLNFKTELPGEIDALYKARKTYLYKDCKFLEEGDLVFFKGNYRTVKEVGFYLDNNIFVAADAGGNVCFHHLRDSINEFHVISNAKIIRDEK
jgi:hypothetical protein